MSAMRIGRADRCPMPGNHGGPNVDKMTTSIERDPEVVRRLAAKLAAKQIETERSIVWAKDQLAALEAQAAEIASMLDEVGALLRSLDDEDRPPLREATGRPVASEGRQ